MSAFSPTIKSIEKSIDMIKTAFESDGKRSSRAPSLGNLHGKEYRDAVEKIEYWRFIQSADYHYFVSRILYLHHILTYSQFCSQQCIENYLKAYLKFKNKPHQNSHNLTALLASCRDIAPVSDTFIKSDRIATIISMYEPFYELARYPVQKTRPKGTYCLVTPGDIYILDYFVMKMREILAIPGNTGDILKKGHESLISCQTFYPKFYSVFFEDNINFVKRKS